MNVTNSETYSVKMFGIRTKLITPGDDLVEIILDAIHNQGVTIGEGDILVIASKAIATSQGRIVELSSVVPSRRAKKLATEYDLLPQHVELILREADQVYGGVFRAILTLKNNVLIPNAGVDRKNAPDGHAVLWPKKPHETAEEIREEIKRLVGVQIGVLIIDSRITPLRMGTTSLAIGIAGFEGVRDCREDRDLYGNPISITRHALADDVASAAHLLMGEVGEKMPVILIKNAPIRLREQIDPESMIISPNDCLFMSGITSKQE
jgi:coenzyme F420-0:L-glutamate ligase